MVARLARVSRVGAAAGPVGKAPELAKVAEARLVSARAEALRRLGALVGPEVDLWKAGDIVPPLQVVQPVCLEIDCDLRP